MVATEDRPGDLLGLRPFGDAVKVVSQGVVDGAAAFLSRICLPAAEELGFLLQDKVRAYRARNVVAVLASAQAKLPEGRSEGLHAPPRLVGAVLEEASWVEDDAVQEKWAGLLASACSTDGMDDSNLLFVDLLRRLTLVEVRIVDYACRTAEKRRTRIGLIVPQPLLLELTPLQEVAGIADVQRLDRELDHLRSLELLQQGGFPMDFNASVATITPTPLALHMYVRCQGSQQSPVDYFGVPQEAGESPTAEQGIGADERHPG
jgi:hypothetical protein